MAMLLFMAISGPLKFNSAIAQNLYLHHIADDQSNDPLPTWNVHSCTPNNFVTWINFTENTDDLESPRMLIMLQQAFDIWNIDRGYILLRARLSNGEQGIIDLQSKRISKISSALEKLGVTSELIWRQSATPPNVQIQTERSNFGSSLSRVDIIIPNSGNSCRWNIRNESLNWFLRNCVGPRTVENSPLCRESLTKIREN